MSVIFIDIDGTVATRHPFLMRPYAQPLPGALDAVKRLKAAGHTIVFFSARFWDELVMTRAWLTEYGFPFDGIILGKPVFDRLIDDRAGFDGNWESILEELGA